MRRITLCYVSLAYRANTRDERGSMIVALLTEKGGTGKTTLATNLAGMRARNRRAARTSGHRHEPR